MKTAIHQPEFFPWVGFFNKMAKADKFVLLDNVQYEISNFQNRNRIVGTETPQFLIMPIERKGFLEKTFKDIKIQDNSKYVWKRKFLATIRYHYSKHPYFNRYYPFIEGLVQSDINSLYDFNIQVIFTWASELGIHPEFIRASDLMVCGKKSALLVDICKKIHTDVYISGMGAKEYIDMDLFAKNDIDVIYNQYVPREYPQIGRKEFIPYLSTLDLLMNVGPEKARELILDEDA